MFYNLLRCTKLTDYFYNQIWVNVHKSQNSGVGIVDVVVVYEKNGDENCAYICTFDVNNKLKIQIQPSQ